MNPQRLVVKLGTNLLTAGTDRLDLAAMAGIVSQVAIVKERGCQVALVSSGAIAAGRHELGLQRDTRQVPLRQILAAVGQSRLMSAWADLFRWHGLHVAQVLLTRGDLATRVSYLNARTTMLGLLDLGVVPVINENDVVATDEIQDSTFGDNDHLSALVAAMLDADMLLMLTDTGGLYDADPATHPQAMLIHDVPRVSDAIEQLAGASRSGRGKGGMATKVAAARLATASGIEVVVADGHRPGVLQAALAGEPVGTRFHATTTRPEARKRWIASGLARRGVLRLDAGALRAVVDQGRSLLPAGVTAVEGRFDRGDSVALADAEGRVVAHGITNYSSADIARILGVRSREIPAILGYEFGEEIVHRNNLVLVQPQASPSVARTRSHAPERDSAHA